MTNKKSTRKSLALILTTCFVLVMISAVLIGIAPKNNIAQAAGEDVIITASVSAVDGGTALGTSSDGKPMIDSAFTGRIKVTYSIHVAEGKTLNALAFTLTYDKDVFTVSLSNVAAGTILGGGTVTGTTDANYDIEESGIKMNFIDAQTAFTSETDVVLATAEFGIKDNAFAADTYSFGLADVQAYKFNAGSSTPVAVTCGVTSAQLVLKNQGTITNLPASFTFEYNGQAIKDFGGYNPADTSTVPADDISKAANAKEKLEGKGSTQFANYVLYTYNGQGADGGTASLKWYASATAESPMASAPTTPGNYWVVVDITEGAKYTAVSSAKVPVTINKFDLAGSYTADCFAVTASKPYDGGNDVTWNSDDVTYTKPFTAEYTSYNVTTLTQQEAGDYKLTITVTVLPANQACFGFYDDTEFKNILTIEKDVAIAAATDNEWTKALADITIVYGETIADSSKPTAKYGTVLLEYKNGETWSTTCPTNAGSYKIRASVAATSSYNALAAVEKDLTITRKVLTLSDDTVINATWMGTLGLPSRYYSGAKQTWAANQVTGWNGSAAVATATADGSKTLGDMATLTVATATGTTDADYTNVGTPTLVLTLTMADAYKNNYMFGGVADAENSISAEVTATISPLAIKVEPTAQTVSFNGKPWTDAEANATNNQIPQGSDKYTITLGEGMPSDLDSTAQAATVILYNATGADWINVGKYDLSAKVEGGNYSVTTVNGTQKFEIVSAKEIIPTNISYEYTGSAITPAPAEGVHYTYTVTPKTDVGDYTLVAKLDSGYEWEADYTGTSTSDQTLDWHITKKNITITLTLPTDLKAFQYGLQPASWDGSMVEDNSVAVVGGTGLTFTYKILEENPAYEVGDTYTVTAENNFANYNVTFNTDNSQFTIVKRQINRNTLSVTFAEADAVQHTTYQRKIYDGNAFTLARANYTINCSVTLPDTANDILQLVNSGADIIDANCNNNGQIYKDGDTPRKQYFLDYDLTDTTHYELIGEGNVEVFVLQASNSVKKAPVVTLGSEAGAEPVLEDRPWGYFAFGNDASGTNVIVCTFHDDTTWTSEHTGSYGYGATYYARFVTPATDNWTAGNTYVEFTKGTKDVDIPIVTFNGNSLTSESSFDGMATTTYNGAAQSFTFNPDSAGFVVLLDKDVDGSWVEQSSGATAKDVGTYRFRVKPAEGFSWKGKTGDAAIKEFKYKLVIEKKALTLKLDDAEVVYGTPASSIIISVTGTGFAGEETLDSFRIADWGTYAAPQYYSITTNAGSTTSSIGWRNNSTLNNELAGIFSNYNLTKTKGTITVTKADITVTGASDYSGTYDGATHNLFSGTVTTVNNSSCTYYKSTDGTSWNDVSGIETETVKNVADSGTYYIKITAANHNDKVVEVKVSITAYEVKVVLDNKTSVYKEDLQTLTYTATQKDGSALPAFATSGDTKLTVSPTTTATTTSAPGEYPITFTNANTNYDVTVTNGIYTITQATNSITFQSLPSDEPGDESALFYGTTVTVGKNNNIYATAKGGTIAYTFHGPNMEEGEFKSLDGAKNTYGRLDAGTWTVKASTSGDGNYGAAEATAIFTIHKGVVTVVFNNPANPGAWSDQDVTYNGAPQNFEPLTIKTFTGAAGVDDVTADNVVFSAKYDGSTTAPTDVKYNGTSVATYAVELLITLNKDSDNLNLVLYRKQTGTSLVTTGYTLQINPYTLTVATENKQSVVGDPLEALTYKDLKHEGGDVDSFVTSQISAGTLTLTLSIDGNPAVVDTEGYPIKCALGGTNAGNYTLTTTEGAYKVLPKDNTVTFTQAAYTITYADEIVEGTTFKATATSGTVIYNIKRASSEEDYNLLSSVIAVYGILPAGDWMLQAYVSAASAGDYGEATATATLTIQTATPDVAQLNPSYTYSDGAPVISWSAVTKTTTNKTIADLVYKNDSDKCSYKLQYSIDGTNYSDALTATISAKGSYTIYVKVVDNTGADTTNFAVATLDVKNVYEVTFSTDAPTGETLSGAEGIPVAAKLIFAGDTVPAFAVSAESHEFGGWKKADSSAFTLGTDAVNSDLALTADWQIHKYTVTWVNWNDEQLEKDENVPYGATPSYDGSTPTKPTDNESIYTFANWTPAVSAVTANVTYKATFSARPNSHTVKYFYSLEGATAQASYTQHGATDGVSVNFGATIALPSVNDLISKVSVPFFRLDGWYTNPERTQKAPATMGGSDLSLYASFVFDIGTGDVDGDGAITLADSTIYRQYLVGGYAITVIDVANMTRIGGGTATMWDYANDNATIGGKKLSETTAATRFIKCVADIYTLSGGDGSYDIRDVAEIRMALAGGYGVDIFAGVQSSAAVSGEAIASGTFTTTVYFFNSQDWTDIYAYSWHSGYSPDWSTDASHVVLTAVAGQDHWYQAVLPGRDTQVIFHNGKNNADNLSNRTGTLTINKEHPYFVGRNQSDEVWVDGFTREIYYYSEKGWTGVKLYAFTQTSISELSYNKSVHNAAFDSAPNMEAVSGHDNWFKATVSTGYRTLIFHNGLGGDDNQTANIDVDYSKQYYQFGWANGFVRAVMKVNGVEVALMPTASWEYKVEHLQLTAGATVSIWLDGTQLAASDYGTDMSGGFNGTVATTGYYSFYIKAYTPPTGQKIIWVAYSES